MVHESSGSTETTVPLALTHVVLGPSTTLKTLPGIVALLIFSGVLPPLVIVSVCSCINPDSRFPKSRPPWSVLGVTSKWSRLLGWTTTHGTNGVGPSSEKYVLAPGARPPGKLTKPSLASVTVNVFFGPSYPVGFGHVHKMYVHSPSPSKPKISGPLSGMLVTVACDLLMMPTSVSSPPSYGPWLGSDRKSTRLN